MYNKCKLMATQITHDILSSDSYIGCSIATTVAEMDKTPQIWEENKPENTTTLTQSGKDHLWWLEELSWPVSQVDKHVNVCDYRFNAGKTYEVIGDMICGCVFCCVVVFCHFWWWFAPSATQTYHFIVLSILTIIFILTFLLCFLGDFVHKSIFF